MDDSIDLVLVIMPVYSDVIIMPSCLTLESGTHFVADLSDLILWTSDLCHTGEDYHVAVVCAKETS